MAVSAPPSNAEANTSIGDQMTALQQAQAKEQEDKKQVVVDAIKGICTADSPFEDLRTISAALQNDQDDLVAKIISGGKTNFSYKIHLKSDPSKAMYAKIAFNYALWNPDRTITYDLKRMDNEYWIMSHFDKIMGCKETGVKAPIATPYAIIDLNQNSKLMVTKWAQADEQWCNQFIEGQVDRRVIPKVARALAKLNLTTTGFDPDFNEQVRYTADNMFTIMKDVGKQLRDETSREDADKCVLGLQDMDPELFDQISDASLDSWHEKGVLSHADAHVFNILVEKKPDVAKLESFGPNGDFTLCDWEMSASCSKGTDAGRFMFFPIVCALCHAVQGHKTEALHILDCVDTFWHSYAEAMRAGGKDEKYLLDTYRNALGSGGVFLFLVFYILKFFQDVAPLHGVPEQDARKAIGVSGYVGLKLMECGFGRVEEDLTLEELCTWYKQLVHGEVEELLSITTGRRPQPRRSSVLRAIGRRVSDSSVIDNSTIEMSRRFSTELAKRRSSVLDPNLVIDFNEIQETYLAADDGRLSC